jgi:hypothetical protein
MWSLDECRRSSGRRFPAAKERGGLGAAACWALLRDPAPADAVVTDVELVAEAA